VIRVTALLASAAVACSSSGSAAGAPDASLEERGAASVRRRGCADCHQEGDAGAAVLAGRDEPLIGTEVFPPNLTPDRETGLGAWSDEDIARAMRDGFAPGPVFLCRQMPRFDSMTDSEAIAVIAYLRSLPAVRHAVKTSVCPPIRPARPRAGSTGPRPVYRPPGPDTP